MSDRRQDLDTNRPQDAEKLLRVLRVLRDRQATARELESIGRDGQWTRYHRVRRGLVLHPRTPLAMARNLVPYLFWKDLADVSGSIHVNPVVRRQAEGLLETRLFEMTLGEKVSLARQAGRGILIGLIGSSEPLVLQSLLGNPRLVEEDVVKMARRQDLDGAWMEHLCEHPKWSVRQAVRFAMVANPRTPIRVALHGVPLLASRDLKQLTHDPNIRKIVAVSAHRELESRRVRHSPAPRPSRDQ